MCEYVIVKLRHWVSENKTEEEIEEALEKVCGYMPKSVRDQCDNVVETYGKAIVEMIASDVDPKEVCSLIQLCDNAVEDNPISNDVPVIDEIAEEKKADAPAAPPAEAPAAPPPEAPKEVTASA